MLSHCHTGRAVSPIPTGTETQYCREISWLSHPVWSYRDTAIAWHTKQSQSPNGKGTRTQPHSCRELIPQRHKVTVTFIHGCRFPGQLTTLYNDPDSDSDSHKESQCHPQVRCVALTWTQTMQTQGYHRNPDIHKHIVLQSHTLTLRPTVTCAQGVIKTSTLTGTKSGCPPRLQCPPEAQGCDLPLYTITEKLT